MPPRTPVATDDSREDADEADRFDEAEAVALGEPDDDEPDADEPDDEPNDDEPHLEEVRSGDDEDADEPDESQEEGAAALTEARRRRRLRFPPRR